MGDKYAYQTTGEVQDAGEDDMEVLRKIIRKIENAEKYLATLGARVYNLEVKNE